MNSFDQPPKPQNKDNSSQLCNVRTVFKAAFSYVSFSYLNSFLDKGNREELNECSTEDLHPNISSVQELEATFTAIYNDLKIRWEAKSASKINLLLYTLIRFLGLVFWIQFFWGTVETVARLLIPLFLRNFLRWLEDYNSGAASYYEGWLWGLNVSICLAIYMLIHHRLIWLGMIAGYKTKVAVTAAVHSKMLRLNSSTIAKVGSGHIINLVSNDTRKFDLVFAFLPYLVLGPLETMAVLIMVSLVLGILPAISGISCILLIIPVQSYLSKYIAKTRNQTALVTDKRINLMQELISGILTVKMLSWETPLLDQIYTVRKAEHSYVKQTNNVKANTMALNGYMQSLTICLTLVVYRFTGNEFNIPDVFFAVSLLALPRMSMSLIFSLALQALSELFVTVRRIDAFLKISEPELSVKQSNDSYPAGEISVQNREYGWYNVGQSVSKEGTKQASKNENQKTSRTQKNTSDEVNLIKTVSDLTLHIKPCELVGIVGKVGSGKSSLLAALLSDIEVLNPDSQVNISGTISHCSQVPWILPATVCENILFGKPYDEKLYNEVVQSCALEVDIAQFPDGDNTEVGERGINLSGGQKARIALARAAYNEADVNLLDDPLSAVDSTVGRILFENCIGGKNAIMKNSTRVLVTHQRTVFPFCDRIILMNDGRIECVGTWAELSNHELLQVAESRNGQNEVSLDKEMTDQSVNEQISSNTTVRNSVDGKDQRNDITELGQTSNCENAKQLVQNEKKETGKVALLVYWQYIVHVGTLPITIATVLLIISKVLHFGIEWWVAAWAATDVKDQREHKWPYVLLSLTASKIIMVLISVFSFFSLLLQGSTRLHDQMAESVLNAPLSFFHTNPVGRILNRFSKGLGMQDEELPNVVVEVLLLSSYLVGTIVLVAVALPYIIPLLLLLFYILLRIRTCFLCTSREAKRYESLTMSPVYAMFALNLKGVSTIRSFGKEDLFHKKMLKALDSNGSWWLAFHATVRWFGFRLDGVSVFTAFLSIATAILSVKIVSREILALALANVISMGGLLQWCMRQTGELGTMMTAVERNLEYAHLEQESSKLSEDCDGTAPLSWPITGTIEYVHVTASYRPGLNPVLNDLQFVIPGGSSVGIVGRTGSGKSSLLLTLFRLLDVSEGRIYIDDVDITTVKRSVLRKQMAVIPQDPVLFSGTLRANLDPCHEHADDKIWEAISKVQLENVARSFGGLTALVSDCGNNFSVGERQLFCLSRALLTDSRIVALDEATANVDQRTDAIIQDSLHSLIARKEKTFLIVAHRIETVSKCDLLLVLDEGRIVEFGSPDSLLQKENGVFHSMVETSRKASIDHTDIEFKCK